MDYNDVYYIYYIFHLDVRMSSIRNMFTGLMECVYDMTLEICDYVLAMSVMWIYILACLNWFELTNYFKLIHFRTFILKV